MRTVKFGLVWSKRDFPLAVLRMDWLRSGGPERPGFLVLNVNPGAPIVTRCIGPPTRQVFILPFTEAPA